MHSLTYLSLVALLAASVKATNTTGDPANIANWPPCAQTCIPQGLNGPAACGSLANITCVCKNPAFAPSIAGCEHSLCNSTEFAQISTLSVALCAPVGGEAPMVTSSIASFIATASLSSGTATLVSAASSELATATQSPELGNPANILTYPQCAQICSNETAATGSGCNANDITCTCGVSFRSKTAACEKVSCSTSDYNGTSTCFHCRTSSGLLPTGAEIPAVTQTLAIQLCSSLYGSIPPLGTAVSSAIASATAVAAAAVKSKDPTSVLSYPACAQACQNRNLPLSGCGSLSNRVCVCQASNFNANTGPCETATCSESDLEVISALSYALCNPVGGIGHISNGTFLSPGDNATFANGSTTGTGSTPVPTSFTGAASSMFRSGFSWVSVVLLSLVVFL